MKRKYRVLFHEHGIHDYCKVVQMPKVIGYDHVRKYIPGSVTETVKPDGSIEWTRDFIDVTMMTGEPILGELEEVHNP